MGKRKSLKTDADSVHRKLTINVATADKWSVVAESTRLKTGPATNTLAFNSKLSKKPKTYIPLSQPKKAVYDPKQPQDDHIEIKNKTGSSAKF